MPKERKKILIVDDDRDVTNMIKDILQEEGFDPYLSLDGKEAVAKIKEIAPDLVLLDCYLPEIMGLDILKEIRKMDDEVAVIMMTGHGEEQLVVALMKAGASDYLKKPLGKFTLLSAVKDVLRKKDINREIIQSERLLLLGKLFPFVAHEIRNPLHAIGGALTIIQKRIVKDPLVDQSINIINEEIVRLTNFVKECLDFSNPYEPSRLDSTDINDVITSSLDLMSPIFNDHEKKIDVQLLLKHDLPKIRTNFNEIKQVFLNIIKNAVEAIEQEGTITIKTDCIASPHNNLIKIVLADTGKGIKQEIVKKIFDPFFSTKTGDGGVGLGLTVCRKIICENHHGTFTIESEENKGTEVTIVLPSNN
jgi:signal transduction histidine kinase